MSTKIEWARNADGSQGETWNPVSGCTKISPGCTHCYAERMAKRLQAMGAKGYENGFDVTLHPEKLNQPLKWKKPRTVFVCSMGDLFHERVLRPYIDEVFHIMLRCPQHTFQILTKRAERMRDYLNCPGACEPFRLLRVAGVWPLPNVWCGVSVESTDYLNRIDHLLETSAAIRFISFEPLLGPVKDFPIEHIDWLVAGGESGPGARPMKPEWVRAIRDQCVESNTPFFLKQIGGVNKKKAGRMLEGTIWDQMPERRKDEG